MKQSELEAAALLARPVEIAHHTAGRTLYYEWDPRFDPEEWRYALAGVAIARAAGASPTTPK